MTNKTPVAYLPVIIRSDGVYVDMRRLGDRAGPPETDRHPPSLLPQAPLGGPVDVRFGEMVVGERMGEWPLRGPRDNVGPSGAAKSLHNSPAVDPVPIFIDGADHDGVTTRLDEGVFAPPKSFWQDVDLDAADEKMERTVASGAAVALNEAMKRHEVDVLDVKVEDHMVPPGRNSSYVDLPPELDIRVHVQMTGEQASRLAKILASSPTTNSQPSDVHHEDPAAPEASE